MSDLVDLPHYGQPFQSPTNSMETVQYIPEFIPVGVTQRIGGGNSCHVGTLADGTVLKYPLIQGEIMPSLAIEYQILTALGNHKRIIQCSGLTEDGLKLEWAKEDATPVTTLSSHDPRTFRYTPAPVSWWHRMHQGSTLVAHPDLQTHRARSGRQSACSRRLSLRYAAPGKPIQGRLVGGSKQDIHECNRKIQSKYLKQCNYNEPVQWLAQQVAHVLIMEMRFKLHGQQRYPLPTTATPCLFARNQLLLAAIDIVDIPNRLATEPHAQRWKWLLHAYLQFLPLSFILTELCYWPNNEITDRSWNIAECAFVQSAEVIKNSNNGKVLNQLMGKAKIERQSVETVKTSLLAPDTAKTPSQLVMTICGTPLLRRDSQLVEYVPYSVGRDSDELVEQSSFNRNMAVLDSISYDTDFSIHYSNDLMFDTTTGLGSVEDLFMYMT
ncbi:hypothetical protein B7463_g9860, partial [Scytalidium lignicola]